MLAVALFSTLSCLAFAPATPLHLPPASRAALRARPPALGLFDGLKKAFENQDYSTSPAAYEQTNARASHILVASEAEAQSIKEQLAAGTLQFEEAAMASSSCASASRGGKLGKFFPGTMVKEFDDVVFGLSLIHISEPTRPY